MDRILLSVRNIGSNAKIPISNVKRMSNGKIKCHESQESTTKCWNTGIMGKARKQKAVVRRQEFQNPNTGILE
jgi:hypothetical protein